MITILIIWDIPSIISTHSSTVLLRKFRIYQFANIHDKPDSCNVLFLMVSSTISSWLHCVHSIFCISFNFVHSSPFLFSNSIQVTPISIWTAAITSRAVKSEKLQDWNCCCYKDLLPDLVLYLHLERFPLFTDKSGSVLLKSLCKQYGLF